MIPVHLQHEPTAATDNFDFDARVRQRGRKWLLERGLLSANPVLPGTEMPTYWRECLGVLHAKYSGICAYLCVYLEQAVGGVSVDHFVAKSPRPDRAYEWDNYRLASTAMNSRKHVFDDVLDPFTLAQDTFHLELVTGRIHPNPGLPPAATAAGQDTIDRLGLDDDACRKMRIRRFEDYQSGNVSAQILKRDSPFIWDEANRQGLL